MEPTAEPAAQTYAGPLLPEPAPLPPEPVHDIPPIVHKAKPAATVTPEALAFHDAETVRQVTDSMKEVDAAQKEFEALNSQAKEAKVKWQGLVQKQHALIRERRDTRGKHVQKDLFSDVIRPDDAPEQLALPGTAEVEVAPDALENLWREFPLDRFSIWGATEADLKKLGEGTRKRDEPRPLATMGQLADFSSNVHNPGFENRLTDFKGIGAAAADRINAAIEHFWGYWNNGGKTEFGVERGLIREQRDGGEAAVDAGGQGDAGEPGPLGDVVAAVLDRVIPEQAEDVAGPDEADAPFVEPEGEGDEFSLAGTGSEAEE